MRGFEVRNDLDICTTVRSARLCSSISSTNEQTEAAFSQNIVHAYSIGALGTQYRVSGTGACEDPQKIPLLRGISMGICKVG